jgi:fused signal recognition particle receptor
MLKQLLQRWSTSQRDASHFDSEASRQAQLDLLEEHLILADVGVDLSVRLVDALRADMTLQTPLAVQQALTQTCQQLLAQVPTPPQTDAANPHVVLMVGVNGAGKTTAIGKLAHHARQQQQAVWIGAGDTFRAAAQEQLTIWSDRAGAHVYTGHSKDAAAVLFDTITQGHAAGAKLVLLDTAGRLQNQRNLMDELTKIRQVVGKAMAKLPPTARLDAWLVLDATTGQNALAQLAQFHAAVSLTGIVLSKWDGSAKGGIVLALADQFKLPVVWVGTGEQLTDLTPFDAQHYLGKLLPQG